MKKNLVWTEFERYSYLPNLIVLDFHWIRELEEVYSDINMIVKIRFLVELIASDCTDDLIWTIFENSLDQKQLDFLADNPELIDNIIAVVSCLFHEELDYWFRNYEVAYYFRSWAGSYTMLLEKRLL